MMDSGASDSALRVIRDPLRDAVKAGLVVALLGLAGVAAGCQRGPDNRLVLTDHRGPGGPVEHFEDFDAGYFRVDPNGMVEIVLTRESDPAVDPELEVTQILRLRGYWAARPGHTYAERTMLNARLNYCLFRGTSGISYDGGGFMRYHLKADALDGVFEGAALRATRQTGADLTVFRNAVVSGRFRAVRDDLRVVRALRDIERRLGHLPETEIGRPTPAL